MHFRILKAIKPALRAEGVHLGRTVHHSGAQPGAVLTVPSINSSRA
jgi:hypothetical protein